MGLKAGFAHVIAHLGGSGEAHRGPLVAVAGRNLHNLVLHHGVRAGGHGRPRHDAHRAARLDRALEDVPRGLMPDHGELHG